MWQGDLRPDRSPFILDLGNLALPVITTNPTPFPQMDPKASQVLQSLSLSGGGEGVVLPA